MKNKKMYIIVGIIGFCLLCCLISPFLSDVDQTQKQEENGVIENNNKNVVIYSKNEKINKFVSEFNSINPDYAFDLDMIHNELSHKIYVYNKKLSSIEILSKTDDGKDMISIQMEDYGDTTDLKNMFGAMLKVFIKNISNEKIDELWNQLVNGKYTVDYSENKSALKYENVYMSFNDSGDVEVKGKIHFCFVRIYGEK